MAPKPQKPKPKQDNRVLTLARRAVLYDQWLGGRSLEELSAKWRKPIHRINEALTMERAERKVAQAIKDSNERKANHEVVIEPPDHIADAGKMVDAAPTRSLLSLIARVDEIVSTELHVEPIETVATYSEVEAAFDAIDKALPAEVGRPPTPVADLIEDAIRRRLG